MSLQEPRNVADYDPTNPFRTVHGSQAIDLARIALHHWEAAPDAERRTFLMLLLFPPRQNLCLSTRENLSRGSGGEPVPKR